MRAEIGQQLSAGQSPEQVRDWFIQRYGPDILADPPSDGVGALLWVVPAAAFLTAAGLAVRTLRRRRAPDDVCEPARDGPPRSWPRHAWAVGALATVALVGGVAVAAGKLGGGTDPPHSGVSTPSATQAGDPATEQVRIGEALEQQGQFQAAAEVTPPPGQASAGSSPRRRTIRPPPKCGDCCRNRTATRDSHCRLRSAM